MNPRAYLDNTDRTVRPEEMDLDTLVPVWWIAENYAEVAQWLERFAALGITTVDVERDRRGELRHVEFTVSIRTLLAGSLYPDFTTYAESNMVDEAHYAAIVERIEGLWAAERAASETVSTDPTAALLDEVGDLLQEIDGLVGHDYVGATIGTFAPLAKAYAALRPTPANRTRATRYDTEG